MKKNFPIEIFAMPFAIANEVVKRNKEDNRRNIDSAESGGNDFFYLGTAEKLIEKFAEVPARHLQKVQNQCITNFNNHNLETRTLKKGDGMRIPGKVA